MNKKNNNTANRFKPGLLILVSSFLLLCLFTTTYSAEKNGKDAGEVKNNVFNLYDSELGRVDEKGTVYNKYGSILGSVDMDGIIYNVSNLEIGNIEPDGSILNQSGTMLGSVNEKGEVFNRSGMKVGVVKDISDIKLAGGAARLIFLK